MRIFATLLSVALLSIPGASLFSQDMMMDGTGFYVAAGGGATLITDTTDTPQSANVPEDDTDNKADWDLDFGFSAGGAAGYDFGDFRTEAEFSFQSANFRHDEKIDNDKDDQKADDNLTVMAILANGFFDLDTGTPFVPFIGIGVGAVNLSVKLFPSRQGNQTALRGQRLGLRLPGQRRRGLRDRRRGGAHPRLQVLRHPGDPGHRRRRRRDSERTTCTSSRP